MEGLPGRHSYEPSAGHRLKHDPFNAIVAPRPIGWIGTRSKEGARNLAPYSFFNAFGYRPPTVGFSSEGWKDSVRNVQDTGLFTWSLATRPLAEQMNASSAPVEAGVDEFALAGLEAVDGPLLGMPLVKASPVAFECRMSDLVRLRTADGAPMNNWLVIGEVAAVHIDPAFLGDGVYDTAAAHPITRGGGPADYFEITEAAKFLMRRPS